MVELNEYGEIIDNDPNRDRNSNTNLDYILANLPIINKRDYGFEEPSIYQRVGEKLSRYFPTFTNAYLSIRHLFRNS